MREPQTPASAPTRNPVKRGAFERMMKIYGWLQDGKYPHCTTIAGDLEVSLKTAAWGAIRALVRGRMS